jgi:hypothetical protein
MVEYYTKFFMCGLGSDPSTYKVSKFAKVPLMEVYQDKSVKGITRIHRPA